MRCTLCDTPCEKNTDSVYNPVTGLFDTTCGICKGIIKQANDDFFIDNDVDNGVHLLGGVDFNRGEQ